ncbi:MAG: putative ABC transport system permease protein [Patescibacteria group bacterium]|jgi:putative ABC transport system permease protein
MLSKESINYALRNLQSQKKRNALTIFSIMIGITTLFLFISFGLGLQTYLDEILSESSANKILIQPKGVGAPGLDTTFKLTDKDVKAVERTSGITQATGVYFKAAEIKQDGKLAYAFISGYDPDVPIVLEISNIEIENGRELRSGEKGKVVLGYNYLLEDKIFKEAYDIGDKIEVNGIDMRIVGFYNEIGNPQDDSNIYVTQDYYEDLFADDLSFGVIVAESGSIDMQPVIDRVESKLRNSRGVKEGKEDFQVQSYDELLDSFLGAISIVYGFIILIALISVLVSSINTANTMITSVLERYKEIGVLKAIGARNSDIFNIFLFESSVLGAAAGIIGVGFGWILDQIATNVLTDIGYSSLAPASPFYLFVGCIIFSTVTGAISGIFPAINASKINTVDALRYQ